MEKDSELRLRHYDVNGRLINNVIQLEYINEDKNITYSPTSNTASNLFNQAMRATPRTIIFGEVRADDEIGLVMTAAAAGHNVMFTVHSDSPAATIERLTTALSKVNPGQQKADIVKSICDTLDIIIVPAQVKDGTRKVLEIAEVKGCKVIDGITTPDINILYKFKQTGYVNKKVYGEHVQINTISNELLEKWSRKGMEPEVKEFLQHNFGEGTYNGEVSPYRYPPGYEGDDTDIINPTAKDVDWSKQMKINPKPKAPQQFSVNDILNEFNN